MTFKCPRGGPDRDKKKKKRRAAGAGAQQGGGDSEAEEPLQPKPTLRVQRKGDVFTIQVSFKLVVQVVYIIMNLVYLLNIWYELVGYAHSKQ